MRGEGSNPSVCTKMKGKTLNIKISNHAKKRFAERFRVSPTEKDLKKFRQDIAIGNCHYKPLKEDNKLLIRAILAGQAVTVVYDFITDTIVTIMHFSAF
jgi:hypothetical protein